MKIVGIMPPPERGKQAPAVTLESAAVISGNELSLYDVSNSLDMKSSFNFSNILSVDEVSESLCIDYCAFLYDMDKIEEEDELALGLNQVLEAEPFPSTMFDYITVDKILPTKH